MIPCTGTIKASDVNTELGRTSGYNFRIGNTNERALARVPNGLIKFSDFACKSSYDPFPWFLYAVEQTGGRGINTDPGTFRYDDGNYSVLWGGTNGWFKFNNKFFRTITSITFQMRYSGRNGGWHGINMYERSNSAGSVNPGNHTSLQTFTLSVNIAPGSEVWINWSGGGDRGDGNNLDYLAITSATFA